MQNTTIPLLLAILGILILALAGLRMIRFLNYRSQCRNRGRKLPKLSREWIGVTLGVTGIIILLAAICIGLSSPASNETNMQVPTLGNASEPVEDISVRPTEEPTAPTPTEPPLTAAEALLTELTVEEKVGQLFLARCREGSALTDIEKYHLGGFVLFGTDIEGETFTSLRSKLQSYQDTAKIPMLIAVDEEGGTVCRVSCYSAFRDERFPSPRKAFAEGGMEGALEIQKEISQMLSLLGINVNLGPVCDIATSGGFMYSRSLGEDAQTTAEFISGAVQIMDEYKVGSTLKHFPGYGENADTHVGSALDERTLDSLERVDLVPFQAGIDAGCGAIMVSHTIVAAMDNTMPASLSAPVHEYLRQNMGYEGVILTDDLKMQAISNTYGVGESAVLAVLAGNDLLCSSYYVDQYYAVLTAVQEGRISMELLDGAVLRVLNWKMNLGLLE